MIKQPSTKTKAPQKPTSLGKGTYVQTALHTDTIQQLPAQKPPEINSWATYKFYKTS